MLNEVHKNYHNRYPFVQLAQLYMRGLIYNAWQYYLKLNLRTNYQRWQLTANIYQQHLARRFVEFLKDSISQNVKYVQKRKRKVS